MQHRLKSTAEIYIYIYRLLWSDFGFFRLGILEWYNMPSKKHNTKYLRRRDIFGRDYSNIVSSLANAQIYNDIDPYSHDYENGYSPLHTSLRLGQFKKSFKLYKIWKTEKEYLSHKYSGHILNQKDRENLTPIDLYNVQFQTNLERFPKRLVYRHPKSALGCIDWVTDFKDVSYDLKSNLMVLPKSEEEAQYLRQNRGSHILTLGSNINYQLGTGTKDDRQNFFQLHIDQLNEITFPPSNIKFKEIKITKYHCMVRTTDDQIYACGNSTRGRLGNDSTESPLFSFTKVLDMQEAGIQMLKTSDNHSILLDGNGDVYTWGWNAYNQLCYPTTNKRSKRHDNNNLDNICSAYPHKVHFFDDKEVTMVSCSSIHSCILTKDNMLYIWGLNVGQMGNSKISHISPDTEYSGQLGHIMSKPVTVNLSHLKIEQVIATDFVTFVRSSGNTLHVFADHTLRTFKVSLAKARSYKEIDPFKDFTPRGIPSDLVDIKCSNLYGNNVCFKFSCGRIGIISTKNESIKIWSKFPNNLPINLYWSPDIAMHKCLDFDVGSKGGLIVCTYGGEIFTSNNMNDKFEKMHSSKLISGRAIVVSCDSSFDSFAVVKDESNTIAVSYPIDDIDSSFIQYSPLNEMMQTYEGIMYKGLKDIDESDIFSKMNGSINPTALDIASNKCSFDIFLTNETDTDYTWGCHKTIMKSRCKKLIKNLKDFGTFIVDNGLLIFKLKNSFNGKVWNISVSSTSNYDMINETINDVLHFLYTDTKPLEQNTARLLTKIVEDSLHSSKLGHYTDDLLNLCLTFDNNNGTAYECLEPPDTIVHLKDGLIMNAHSLVLSSRSIFFNSILNESWKSVDENGKFNVYLNHIDKNVFLIVLKYIYGLSYEDIFDLKLLNHSFVSCLELLLETLCISDELNCVPLSTYLVSILARYVNGGTVIPILLYSINIGATILTESCYIFLCAHIGILFCKENLEIIGEYFDDTIWNGLYEQFQQFRLDKLRKPQFLSWYDVGNIDWLGLFKSNFTKFNSIFMQSQKQFEPVFDLQVALHDNKQDSKARRRSSVNPKSRMLSSVHGDLRQPSTYPSTENFNHIITLEDPLGDSISLGSENSSAVEDEPVDFIKVIKNSKRRSSAAAIKRSSEVGPVLLNSPVSEIVLHTSSERSNSELPTLLSTDNLDQTDDKTLPSKISGSFRKNTQKQRKQQFNILNKQDDHKNKKHVWGKNEPTKSVSSYSKSPTERKNSSGGTIDHLPSLLDAKSAELKASSKRGKNKDKHKESRKTKYTEFVSSGNPGGIVPYITSTKTEINEISSVFGDKSGQAVSSLEEQITALEFEKWFAKESQMVQKKLKKKDKIGSGIEALYTSIENIPTLTGSSDTPRTKKKVRGNFKKKGVRALSEII